MIETFFSLFEKWKLVDGLDYTGHDANCNANAILTPQSLGKFLKLLFLLFYLTFHLLVLFTPLFLDQTFPKYFPNGSAWLLFYFIFECNFQGNFQPQLGEFQSKAFWPCFGYSIRLFQKKRFEMMLTIGMGPHSNLDFYMVKELPKMLINTVGMFFFVTTTKFKTLLYMAELLRPLSFYLNSNENPFTDGSSPCFRYPCLFLFQYVSIHSSEIKGSWST